MMGEFVSVSKISFDTPYSENTCMALTLYSVILRMLYITPRCNSRQYVLINDGRG